tara:strand:- start:3552 stop:5282 length:1731 start_codon:yes stop_codon:yes gene_type:complete
MYFKVTEFSGIAPGVAPRLLADNFAQTAQNIDFEAGNLVPIDGATDTLTLASTARRAAFFYDDTHWLQWDEEDVKAVKGPVANDQFKRLYWTGEDYPRVGTYQSMITGSSDNYPANGFRLGVPAPTAAPTTVKSGTANEADTPNDVSYVYTLVTDLGEEGPPSPASTVIELTDDEQVAVTVPTPSLSGGYNFGSSALKRIYRSNTGSDNTQFQFVGEVPFATTAFTDTTDAANLGEILPSTTWIGPPDDSALYSYTDPNTNQVVSGALKGLTSLANGVFAGFFGNRLCLSEAFLPHAWPIEYRLTLDDDIVAIGATGNGIVCLTNGSPYFVTGVDPSAMTAVKIPIAQACVNARSVVDMGEYILYAAPDGLVAVTGGEAQIVTRGIISVDQWNTDFDPTTIRAFEYEGTYVATNGTTGWVYDPRRPEAAVSTLTFPNAINGGFTKPKDGQLYLISGNKLIQYRGGSTPQTLTWKSKKFVTPKPISMGWVHVDAEGYPVVVKVWADGTLIAHYSISYANNVYTQTTTVPSGISTGTLREPIMRLPAVVGQEWEVEVSGAVTINEVCIAGSIEEIAAT